VIAFQSNFNFHPVLHRERPDTCRKLFKAEPHRLPFRRQHHRIIENDGRELCGNLVDQWAGDIGYRFAATAPTGPLPTKNFREQGLSQSAEFAVAGRARPHCCGPRPGGSHPEWLSGSVTTRASRGQGRVQLASRHAHRHLPAPSHLPGTGRFAVARESDRPESPRCHGIVHFSVFLQHLGAVLGRDRNRLRGNLGVHSIGASAKSSPTGFDALHDPLAGLIVKADFCAGATFARGLRALLSVDSICRIHCS